MPDTVNPSLWRQSSLTAEHGLFEVAEGVWQLRGFDLAVMTLIAGDTGWIVIDPLTAAETAAAALELANETLGARPVSAVIYTHSHADHFGGARGVVDGDATDDTEIVAPRGFTEAALAENLLAGNHMARRSGLMFGNRLPAGTTGNIGAGLGPGLPNGTIGFLPPTYEAIAPYDTRVIDGVTFEFIDAAGTEAPAEFMFYLPDRRILCTAEVATGTLHNALTLRGAKARNLLRWSEVLDDVIARYTDLVIASHHWPVWGRDAARTYLANQRDVYRYTHDQTLRRANDGAGLGEVAELIEPPGVQATDAATRGYYGTLNHDTKAVYQYYFGWWDGVPARFDTHPPAARAARLVAAIGGADATMDRGIDAFETGDYRWAAELFDAVVFAEPRLARARAWLAATYEQLGFQAESGAWRNYYLAAAQELRQGSERLAAPSLANKDFVAQISALDLFRSMATQYVPGAVDGAPYTLQFVFPDSGEAVVVEVRGDVVIPRAGRLAGAAAAATFTLDRAYFNELVLRERSATMLAMSGKLVIDGDKDAVKDFFGALELPDPDFNLVTP